MLAECKLWASAVPQDTVHSFHNVMQGAGANTGFIISKAGFQSGAHEAAQHTNIHLLTWDELQQKFGRQWYLYRHEKVEKIIAELRSIDQIYLEQFSPGPISNWMVYRATGGATELLELLNEIRVVLLAFMAAPKSFDVPGPIAVRVSEGFPGSIQDKFDLPVLPLADVRAFFVWIEGRGLELVERYKGLSKKAHQSFDALADGGDSAFAETMRLMAEELPIRAFKEPLGDDLYERLLREHLLRPANAD